MKPVQAKLAGTMRKIVDFHLDEKLDWVAELERGHQQHVRHNPPWTHAHWVTTPQGRLEHLGEELNCLACRPTDLSLSYSMSDIPVGQSAYRLVTLLCFKLCFKVVLCSI